MKEGDNAYAVTVGAIALSSHHFGIGMPMLELVGFEKNSTSDCYAGEADV